VKFVKHSFVIVVVTVLALQLGCKDEGTGPDSGCWELLGLEGKLVNDLVLTDDHLYACAGRDGVYRIERFAPNARWEFLGLADSTVNRQLDAGVTGLVHLNGNLLVSYYASDVSRRHGIYCSTDDGITWQRSDSGMYTSPIYTVTSRVSALAQSPFLPNELFANLSAAMYKSTDGGSSWRLVDGNPEASSHVYTFGFSKTDPITIWAGEETGYFSPSVRRSLDGGENWTAIWFPPNIGPYTYDNAVYDIAIHPTNDSVLYFGMLGVVVKTIDRAQTFQKVLGWEDGIYRHWRLALNLHDPQELLATGSYLYRTTDGGQTWRRVPPPENRIELYALAADWGGRILYASASSPGNGIYRMRF